MTAKEYADTIKTTEQALQILKKYRHSEDVEECGVLFGKALDMVIQALEQIKEGHWVDEKVRWRCSECGWWYPDWKKFNFCPNCGARMVGDNDGR